MSVQGVNTASLMFAMQAKRKEDIYKKIPLHEGFINSVSSITVIYIK